MEVLDRMNRRLKCAVAGGVFSDERVVIVYERGNGPVEFFVPESYVQGEGDHGSVQVRVYDGDGGRWAELPTEYRDVIPINDEQLVS